MPMAPYRQLSDLPQLIPVFPLDGALLLPGGELPLQIFEPRYLNMIDDAMTGDRVIGMMQTRGGRSRARSLAAGRLRGPDHQLRRDLGRPLPDHPDRRLPLQAGEELDLRLPYRQVRADYSRFEADLDETEDAEADDTARDRFARALKRYLNRRELDIDWDSAGAAPLEPLVNSLAMGLPFDPAEKQALLEAIDLPARFEALTTLLEIDADDPMTKSVRCSRDAP
jgi:Lon protease-like protein